MPSPLRWALLVVDMQNDFLDKGGYYARRAMLRERHDWPALSPDRQTRLLEEPPRTSALGVRTPAIARVVANVCAAVSAARMAGRPIAFVRAVYDRNHETLPPLLSNDPDRAHFPCKPGTWGARLIDDVSETIGKTPLANERVFEKHTYDAFAAPSLPRFLRDNEVNAVVVCGTETQVCVSATAQHAALLGFRAFILEDSVWSADSATADAALSIFRDAYGGTLTVGDLAAL